MSVYKNKASPYYRFDFQIDGHRFHGTTKARNKRDAETVERRLKDEARRNVEVARKTGEGPLTIDMAIGRYWTEKGQFLSRKQGYYNILERLIVYFGKDTRLDEIDDGAIINLVAHKRKQYRWEKAKLKNGNLKTLSNASINRNVLVPLKTIFRRAKLIWRCTLPNEPNWKEHWLKEPRERVRELHSHEQQALEESVRDDYRPWFQFLQLSGRRFNETLIKWEDVNWEAGEIVFKAKGDRQVWTPITPTIRKILEACHGHHPEYVFTFVAVRNQKGKIKGQRYPLTYDGAMVQWRRDLKRSGVKNFRLHDNRHDTATKLLRQTRNLKLVQRVLGHTSLATTSKYAHVLDDEVAAALESNAESRKNSRSNILKSLNIPTDQGNSHDGPYVS